MIVHLLHKSRSHRVSIQGMIGTPAFRFARKNQDSLHQTFPNMFGDQNRDTIGILYLALHRPMCCFPRLTGPPNEVRPVERETPMPANSHRSGNPMTFQPFLFFLYQ